jgi:hypothetical protein
LAWYAHNPFSLPARLLPPPRLQHTARGGPQWEEVLHCWVALHAFAARCQEQHGVAEAAEVAEAAAEAAAGAAASQHGRRRGRRSGAGAAGVHRTSSSGASSGSGSGGGSVAARSSGDRSVQLVSLDPPVLVPQLPPLEAFLLDMFGLEGDADAQLEALARYRPNGMPPGDWDRGVSQVGQRRRQAAERRLASGGYGRLCACRAQFPNSLCAWCDTDKLPQPPTSSAGVGALPWQVHDTKLTPANRPARS